MANCHGCSTDLSSQDRFCKNCGAPVAASFEDLVETRPFDPSAPTITAAHTGSLDADSPQFVAAPSTYPLAQSSTPLSLPQAFVKHLLGRKLFWLLGTFLLLLFIATGATVSREILRARRAHRAEQARMAQRARQAREVRQAEIARRSLQETIRNAMGFVPGDLLDAGLPETDGVFVTSLTSDDSPAALAGIQAGDVLHQLGDQPVQNTGELARILNSVKPGSQVGVQLNRDGQPVVTQIGIGSPTIPPFQAKVDPRDQGFLGVGDVARRCCVGGTTRWGLEVRRIIDNSPADLAGLQLGDVITEFAQLSIRTPEELARRIRAVKPRNKVKVKFYRANTERAVELIMGHGW